MRNKLINKILQLTKVKNNNKWVKKILKAIVKATILTGDLLVKATKNKANQIKNQLKHWITFLIMMMCKIIY